MSDALGCLIMATVMQCHSINCSRLSHGHHPLWQLESGTRLALRHIDYHIGEVVSPFQAAAAWTAPLQMDFHDLQPSSSVSVLSPETLPHLKERQASSSISMSWRSKTSHQYASTRK